MHDHPNLSYPARFNHVALSLPADRLDAGGRAEIVDDYGYVFGWEELPTMTADRERLVLSTGRVDQFVYLVAEDEPMHAPPLDHFGFSVASLDDFDEILRRARILAARDDRADLVDYEVDDHEVVRIHSFYLRHLLPLTVEVQWWEWTGG